MDEKSTINIEAATGAVSKLLAEKSIKVLKDIIRDFQIPQYRYSFKSEGEDIVSLLYSHNTWEVTYVERGQRDVRSFDEPKEACEYFLWSISDDESSYEKMRTEFERKTDDTQTKGIAMIREVLKKAANSAAVL